MFRTIFRIVLMAACATSAAILAADSVLNPPQIGAGTEFTLSDFTVDSTGAQYIVGTINGGATVDLNPGVGDVSRTAAGVNAAFIIKLNADSSYVWGHTFDGSSSDFGDAVTLNGGYAYMAGRTNSTDAGFDGAVGVSSAGLFIAAFDVGDGTAKANFDSDGHAEYVDFSSGSNAKITVSGGNLFLGGTSTGSLAQVAKINASSGALDLGFSTDGLQTFGGGTAFPTLNGVAADGTRVYICGTFSGTGAGVGAAGAINSAGANDGFVVGLNLTDGSADNTFSGNGVLTFGGTGNDAIQSISISNGTIYVGGPIGSTDAGFDGPGLISRSATAGPGNNDGFVIALNSSGTPINSFDTDGVLLLPPPGNGGSIALVRVSAEFGGGVTTPGIAVQLTQSPSNSIPNQVVVADFDGNGAKRAAFGINGEIKFDSNSSETGVNVLRSNGRTTIAAIGATSTSSPFIYANNLIPRVLEFRTRVVASFSSDTGSPLFPHFLDVFPRADDVAGGRTVTFSGGGFPAGTPSVKIGVADATGVSTTNGTKFTATVPALAGGLPGGVPSDYPVTITFNGRAITTPNAFAYGNKAQATGPVFRGPARGGTVDADGNTYLVGTFTGTVDFDPSAGSDMHRSGASVATAYVTRFNANGSYAWTSIFTGIGSTTLNSVAVKGNRVYAVGDFQFINAFGEATSNAGINGLSGLLCQGAGDGAILVLDRATGVAVTSVSGDGIVTVGGSTDGNFSNTDALHSIAASPTANMLLISGRMVSTNVGFNGTGAINGDDGVLFFNCDTDLNVTQSTVKDYPFTPPTSDRISSKVSYSPDGAKLTGIVASGTRVDVYRFTGDVAPSPVQSRTGSGERHIDFPMPVGNLGADEDVDITFAVTYSNGTESIVQVLDGASLNTDRTYSITPKPGQMGTRFVGTCDAAFNRVTDELNIAIVCSGDLTITSGALTQNVVGENVSSSDDNIVLVFVDPANSQTLVNSSLVCKSDSATSREDCTGLFPTATGVSIATSTSSSSTVVRCGTQEATPGEFKCAVFQATSSGGGGGPINTPPKITSPLNVDITQGQEITYTLTATGTPNITFVVGTPIDNFGGFQLISSFGLTPVTVVRVGDQLTIKTQFARGFAIGVSANNAFGIDQQLIVFKVTRNPKAPNVTFGTGSFGTNGVEVGPYKVPFTVTGDLPIETKINSGTISTNALGGTEANIIFTNDQADKGDKVTIGVLATNAFGSDIDFMIFGVSRDSDMDDDGIPDATDTDSDGDGIPNDIENDLLTDPNNPASKPSIEIVAVGTGSTKGLTIQLKFANTDVPAVSILDQIEDDAGLVVTGGTLSRAAPKPTPGPLIYELGGVIRMFTIDGKGKGVSGNDKATVKVKSVKGVLKTTITISVKNADSKGKLADEGFTSRTTKKEAITLTSFIAYNGGALNRTLAMEYTAKAGKTGSAKLKK